MPIALVWFRNDLRLDDNPALRAALEAGYTPVPVYLHAPDVKLPREIAVQHAAIPVSAGRFNLHSILQLLAEREINEVQLEAGATLAGAFFHEGLVDELLLYVAPVLLGPHARPLFEGIDIHTMTERWLLDVVDSRQVGSDIRLLLQPRPHKAA